MPDASSSMTCIYNGRLQLLLLEFTGDLRQNSDVRLLVYWIFRPTLELFSLVHFSRYSYSPLQLEISGKFSGFYRMESKKTIKRRPNRRGRRAKSLLISEDFLIIGKIDSWDSRNAGGGGNTANTSGKNGQSIRLPHPLPPQPQPHPLPPHPR